MNFHHCMCNMFDFYEFLSPEMKYGLFSLKATNIIFPNKFNYKIDPGICFIISAEKNVGLPVSCISDIGKTNVMNFHCWRQNMTCFLKKQTTLFPPWNLTADLLLASILAFWLKTIWTHSCIPLLFYQYKFYEFSLLETKYCMFDFLNSNQLQF